MRCFLGLVLQIKHWPEVSNSCAWEQEEGRAGACWGQLSPRADVSGANKLSNKIKIQNIQPSIWFHQDANCCSEGTLSVLFWQVLMMYTKQWKSPLCAGWWKFTLICSVNRTRSEHEMKLLISWPAPFPRVVSPANPPSLLLFDMLFLCPFPLFLLLSTFKSLILLIVSLLYLKEKVGSLAFVLGAVLYASHKSP